MTERALGRKAGINEKKFFHREEAELVAAIMWKRLGYGRSKEDGPGPDKSYQCCNVRHIELGHKVWWDPRNVTLWGGGHYSVCVHPSIRVTEADWKQALAELRTPDVMKNVSNALLAKWISSWRGPGAVLKTLDETTSLVREYLVAHNWGETPELHITAKSVGRTLLNMISASYARSGPITTQERREDGWER